jgi:hypothetical protein
VTETNAIEAYYFGCWQQSGHRFVLPSMRSATYKSGPPTPWGYGLDTSDFDVPEWHTKKLDGWTAIGTRDRTVDSRPGSISVFAFHADLTYADALSLARKTFPDVFARLGTGGEIDERP